MEDAAGRLRDDLASARRALSPRGIAWYPYDTLANVEHLRQLLGDRMDPLLDLARGMGVIDVGCGDGELSFLFERLGCQVTAVDHPRSNQNALAGVRALAQHIGSRVEIEEFDVDRWGIPERREYGLGLLLGVLYHLKNPFLVLETLASRCRFVLLSTRVARRFPDGEQIPERWPIGYLVGASELNDDDSNFWIYSPAGLERLVERCRLEKVAGLNIGDTARSDPSSVDRDERTFLCLRSLHSLMNVDRLAGWHARAPDGWCWTARHFEARVHPAPGRRWSKLTMRVYVNEEVLQPAGGSLGITATFDDGAQHRRNLDRAGVQTIEFEWNEGRSGPCTAAFALDSAIVRAGQAAAEFGIVVDEMDLKA